jgi:hypothetical protein
MGEMLKNISRKLIFLIAVSVSNCDNVCVPLVEKHCFKGYDKDEIHLHCQTCSVTDFILSIFIASRTPSIFSVSFTNNFVSSFFIQKCFAKFFSTYSLAL